MSITLRIDPLTSDIFLNETYITMANCHKTYRLNFEIIGDIQYGRFKTAYLELKYYREIQEFIEKNVTLP